MRLAGTWKQYSKKAIIQLMTMTLKRGADLYLRWPYQANVMKMLEQVRSRIVLMRICCQKCLTFRLQAHNPCGTLNNCPGQSGRDQGSIVPERTCFHRWRSSVGRASDL